MKTAFVIVVFLAILIVYSLLYLGIEIEIKTHMEAPNTNTVSLIKSAARIREHHNIQFLLFFLLLVYFVYLTFRKRSI